MSEKPLQILKKEPDRRLINNLERMLADAKSGEMRGLVAISHTGDGYMPMMAGELDLSRVVYLLERQKWNILRDLEADSQ